MNKKSIIKVISLIIVVCAFIVLYRLNGMARIGVAYMVKVSCSEVFLAGRNLETVLSSDFFNIDPLMNLVKVKQDNESKSMSGSLFGLGKSIAYYREGLGCTVKANKEIEKTNISLLSKSKNHEYTKEINPIIQNQVLKLFDDATLPHPIVTRGAVVIQNGIVIAEHYADSFTHKTRQQSWSMAKGITQALVGIAVKKGTLSLSDKGLLPEWTGEDPRSEISLGDLLQMASGLEFTEQYDNPHSNVDQMLFNVHDMGTYAASQNLLHEPGTKSIYSSGTTNIVSKVLKNTLGKNNISYIDFPNKELFTPLGMSSAIFEVDPSGSFIGSSYVYATARDFARFGQLYLQNGIWNSEKILPSGWVEYTRTSAPNSNGMYGSHWSLNYKQKNFPGMPEDLISLGGNDGQYIFVIPSKNAVIVRLGIMRKPATFENDLYPLIKNIYSTL